MNIQQARVYVVLSATTDSEDCPQIVRLTKRIECQKTSLLACDCDNPHGVLLMVTVATSATAAIAEDQLFASNRFPFQPSLPDTVVKDTGDSRRRRRWQC
jgi:hypothetical protein